MLWEYSPPTCRTFQQTMVLLGVWLKLACLSDQGVYEVMAEAADLFF